MTRDDNLYTLSLPLNGGGSSSDPNDGDEGG